MSRIRSLQTGRKPALGSMALTAVLAAITVSVAPLDISGAILGIVALIVFAYLQPLNGMMVLLVFAPLKALIAAETSYSLPLDIGQIILLVILAIWLLQRVAQREAIRLPTSIVQLPILLFLSAVLLTVPNAPSIRAAISESLKWIEIILLVSLCLAVYRRESIHFLVAAIVVAGSVQALIGLYEFFGGSGAEHLWILDRRYFRAFGTFGQPNPFGAFMGITFPFAVSSAMGHGYALWRQVRMHQYDRLDAGNLQSVVIVTFYALMSLLILAGLLASWSRGAWMGLVVSSLVMIFLVPRNIGLSIILVISTVAIFLGLWMTDAVPDTLMNRMSSFVADLTSVTDVRGADINDDNYAVNERIAHWQTAVAMATDSPLLGVGFGNYEAAYSKYALMNWPQALGHAHNYYLNLLAETGIVGLITYLAMWLGIFAISLQVWWQSQGIERSWSIALIGVWAYLSVHSLVDKIYVNNMFLFFGCMFGLLAILYRKQEIQRAL